MHPGLLDRRDRGLRARRRRRPGRLAIEARASGNLPASPEEVWESIARPERLLEWWPQLTLEPELGGGFLEMWSDGDGAEKRSKGIVTEWRQPELIQLEWSDDDWGFSTEVSISLSSDEAETRVVIVHRGFEAAGARGSELRRAHEDGWQRHLHRWRSYLR
ncbi:MAG: SRPBCC family protein [Solirubrobacterales bacterium]